MRVWIDHAVDLADGVNADLHVISHGKRDLPHGPPCLPIGGTEGSHAGAGSLQTKEDTFVRQGSDLLSPFADSGLHRGQTATTDGAVRIVESAPEADLCRASAAPLQ